MYDPTPLYKSRKKRHFILLLVIAAGLHLIFFFPFITPKLGLPSFESPLIQKPLDTPLSIQLIYKSKNTEVNKVQVTPATGTKPIDEMSFNLTQPKTTSHSAFDIPALNDTEQHPSTIPSTKANSLLSQSLEYTQANSFDAQISGTTLNNDETGIFLESTRQQLNAARQAQEEYEEAQVEEVHYAITEDSDGTRYVNIKGVCWRIPPPGSEEAWTIVYAGCSGQTKTFNLEINIGLDILDPNSPLAID